MTCFPFEKVLDEYDYLDTVRFCFKYLKVANIRTTWKSSSS